MPLDYDHENDPRLETLSPFLVFADASHMRGEDAPSNEGPLPVAPVDAGPDKQLHEVGKLVQHVSQLEALQEEMIQSELDRLGELATLTRIADALSHRRSFDEVLDDCLDEVCRLTGHPDVWVVEAKSDGPIGVIHRLDAPPNLCPLPMPRHVRSVCQRVYANRPHQCLVTSGTSKPDDPDGAYIGMPIFTAKHLVGTLVIRDDQLKIASDQNRVRLIQSVLRQTAMAAENDRLIVALNQMIIEVCCAFALAIESRDAYTGGHVQRVTAYSVLLAQHIGLDQRQQAILRLGGLLHDIGKVAIPDAVLNKPGKLTREEFDVVKMHPVVGHQIIGQIPQLACVNEIIRHHHERWDGKGYPDRLAGQDIPLLARVLAIADTFDAMTSNRAYRDAMTVEVAMKEIRNCAGTQFDAEMAASFALFDRQRLQTACEEMKEWCQVSNHSDNLTIMDMMDLRMPAMAKTGF